MPVSTFYGWQAQHANPASAPGMTSGCWARSAPSTTAPADARRLARRFGAFDDMILRFAAHPGVVAFTNNEAEAAIRGVKVQMRTSGGCWPTLQELTEVAVVRSYLSTAAKWGIDALDALRWLFTTGLWLPPALAPPQGA